MQLSWLFYLSLFVLPLSSSLWRAKEDPWHVTYTKYYYKTLQEKMVESLSTNNCTIGKDIEVLEHPIVDEKVQILYGQHSGKIARMGPVYFHTTSSLCSSEKFKLFMKGKYKHNKGCYIEEVMKRKQQHQIVRNQDLHKEAMVRTKAYHTNYATLHPAHVRCDNKNSVIACFEASKEPLLVPNTHRTYNLMPFVVKAKGGLVVAKSGMLGLNCGPFGLFASCEAVKCGLSQLLGRQMPVCPVAYDLQSKLALCKDDLSSCELPVYNDVFVMTQYDDVQYGQFVLEALPKLILHLDYVRKNVHMKIHYGFSKQDDIGTAVMPHIFFEMLGLKDRLINGSVYATGEVMMPREGGCQDVGYNIWEIVNMRETFLDMVSKNDEFYEGRLRRFIKTHHGANCVVAPYASNTTRFKGKKTIIIIQRSASGYTRNQDRGRRWNDTMISNLVRSFASAFGLKYQVVVFSDKNEEMMRCPLCQVKLFSEANIVVGVHGAGLTNTMYMKAQQVVVELVSTFDSRHAPLTGIFPRLSALLGLHHYSYQIPETSPYTREVQPDVLAHDVHVLVNKIFFGTAATNKDSPFENMLTGRTHTEKLEQSSHSLHSGPNEAMYRMPKKYKDDELGIDYGG